MWKYKFNPLSWEFDLVGGDLDGLASLQSQDLLQNDDLILVNDDEWNAKNVTVSQLVSQTIPDIYNNTTFKYNPNRRLRILSFGSSWFCCNNIYLNYILWNLWIKNEIHHYYMGHSQFDEWIDLYNWNNTPISWSERTRWTVVFKSVDWWDWDKYVANMSWTTYADKIDITIQEFADMWRDDIINGKRDIIILQQWAHQSCKPTYWENQDKYIKFVKEAVSPDTIIAFNRTWAPWTKWTWIAADAYHTATNTVSWQHIFMQDHTDRVRDLMSKEWIYNISPSWVVLQMIREYNNWDTSWYDLTRDNLHPTNWLPCFAINATLYQSIIAPITGIPIKQNTWLPDANTVRTPFSNSNAYWLPVTEEQALKIYNYIDTAIAKRREIIPDEHIATTWNALVDAYEWWSAWLSVSKWTFGNTLVSNTLAIWTEPWYSIKSIKQNGKSIPVNGNVYSVNMTFGWNLFEVEFEKTSTPSTTYTITPTITDWEVVMCPEETDTNWTTLLVRANSNAVLPNTITVVWASYTYDSSTWVIVLSSVTGNVSITVTCVAPRAITYSTTNTYLITAPEEAWASTTIQFEPGTIAYDYPSSVTVTWATSSYDSTTWTITLTNPVDDVTVTINCPEKTVVDWTAYTLGSEWFAAWRWWTITVDRFYLPYDYWTNTTRRWTWQPVTDYKWTWDEWVVSAMFVPAWKKITVHVNNTWSTTHKFAAVALKYEYVPYRLTSIPTYEYWQWTININGVDVTSMFDWTATKVTTQIRPNPYLNWYNQTSDYFPFNTNNDFEFTNTYDYPVYVQVWVTTSSLWSTSPENFSITYTYSTITTYDITTSINWWDLTQNPTSILSDWTATVKFAPTHLFKTYPSTVSVTWATSTYDDATWEIVLSNPTDDVTISINCPDNTVVENTPITIPLAQLHNDITTIVTWARHMFVNWSASTSTRVTWVWDRVDNTSEYPYEDRAMAPCWIPAWKTITIHASNTHKTTKYAVWLFNQKSIAWIVMPRPNVVKRAWAVNANGIDLTAWNTFFGRWDWYSETQTSAYTASTFADYFPYNSSNDYTFTNTYGYPVYLMVLFAGNATNTAMSTTDIDAYYTYSTPNP